MIECRAWLDEVWSRPNVAEGIEQASPTLAHRVAALLAGQPADPRRVRRAALATARYLLRATGRPAPFGLFAGVAGVHFGGGTRVRWGIAHQPVARADTQWLADVIDQLEACPALLDRLDVVVTSLATCRGGRLEIPRGAGKVSISYTPAVRAACALAAAPVRLGVLAGRLAAALDGADRAAAQGMLTALVRHGLLISELRAPFTSTDPLGHLLDRLGAAGVEHLPGAAPLVEELTAVRTGLRQHNQAAADEQHAARAALGARMRRTSTAGRTPLAVDVRLDSDVQLPASVAAELEHAATALLRLTRHPAGQPAWVAYHAAFRDRYGVGTLVPLSEVLDPDAGLGYPAGYPGSTLPAPQFMDPPAVQRRDAWLLALAWAARDGGEVVLTDAAVRELAGDISWFDEQWIPPHVELAARVCAASPQAVDRGDYTLLVAPARAGGTLTSRFTTTATGDGLQQVYRDLPVAAAGALPVQLSFPPAYPHAENICRVPAYLPHVLSLGEHYARPGSAAETATETAAGDAAELLPAEDLALTATADRLHLINLADRRVVEPQVFHALALDKQAPPLARFLAHLPRAWTPAWTVLDWGPHADALPYLPAVRYRRSILTPARWRLTAADLSAGAAEDPGRAGGRDGWQPALERWRRRWGCAASVDLRDEDRSLRLRLDEPMHAAILRAHLDRHGHAVLTDPVAQDGAGWIGGHAHEIAVPLVGVRPPARSAAAGPGAPALLTNRSHRQLPGGPDTRWLCAKLAAHPDRQDEIVAGHLPELIAELGDQREHAATACWFVRYRSRQETDHLRLRVRLPGPDRFGAYATVVGRWADQLCGRGLASGLSFDSYQPEVGRYGAGPEIAAAEEVFVADSRAVTADLRWLPSIGVHRTALAAVGMVHVACGLLGDRGGLEWLAGRSAAPAPYSARDDHGADPAVRDPVTADRAVTDQAVRAVRSGGRPELLGWPPEVATAWQARAGALAAYARHLGGEPAAMRDAVVESLLHMHHNRAVGVDPAHERRCRRLARQAAVTTRAWPAEEHR